MTAMIKRLFKAFGVAAVNSQTFAGGYYYEYSLDITDGVMRMLRNRYKAGDGEPPAKVETPEQIEACRQALMYNFPHAFNIDGSVAIDLPEAPAETTADTATEAAAEEEAGDAE